MLYGLLKNSQKLRKNRKIYSKIDYNFKKYLPYIEKVLKLKINSDIKYNIKICRFLKMKRILMTLMGYWHHDRMFPVLKRLLFGGLFNIRSRSI